MTPPESIAEMSENQTPPPTDWAQGRPPSAWELHTRLSLIEQSNKDIKQELHSINSNISRLVWIVVGAVVMGILNLWVKSGGSVPGVV